MAAYNIKNLLSIFKNVDKITEGIKNNIFRKEHIEAVATERYQI